MYTTNFLFISAILINHSIIYRYIRISDGIDFLFMNNYILHDIKNFLLILEEYKFPTFHMLYYLKHFTNHLIIDYVKNKWLICFGVLNLCQD